MLIHGLLSCCTLPPKLLEIKIGFCDNTYRKDTAGINSLANFWHSIETILEDAGVWIMLTVASCQGDKCVLRIINALRSEESRKDVLNYYSANKNMLFDNIPIS